MYVFILLLLVVAMAETYNKNNKGMLSIFWLILRCLWWRGCLVMAKEAVRVGVILDMNSTVGVMANSCISMAVSDFYAANPYFETRVALFTRDSNGDVTAASAG